MNLVSTYAALFSEGVDIQKTLAYMKARGHLTLLPQIVRQLSREPEKKAATVTLAKSDDAKKFAPAIAETLGALGAGKDYHIALDERAVGGFSVRTKNGIVDKTFRTALVTIYKNTVKN